MSKVTRRIFKGLLVVVVLLVVLLVGVVLFLGPIIKTAAEKVGPKVLGVPVTVSNVAVNVFAGSFGLQGLRVGNPEGYSSDPLVSLGELRVAVKLSSLLGKEAIEIKEITILEPRISYEVVKSVPNVDALMARIQKKEASAAQANKEVAKTDPPAAEKQAGRKVIIDHFECRNGEVSFRAAMTLGQAITVPLPSIVANDIGRKSGGTTMADAIQKMFGEVANGVGRAVVGVAGAVGDVGKAGTDAVKGGVKGVRDAIKGLF